MKYEVEFVDDGKEKWQSHEANFSMENLSYYPLTMNGFGRDKEEATNDLITLLEELSKDLLISIKQIKNGVFKGGEDE